MTALAHYSSQCVVSWNYKHLSVFKFKPLDSHQNMAAKQNHALTDAMLVNRISDQQNSQPDFLTQSW